MEDLQIAGSNKFDVYKCDANEVLHFKLVRSEADVFDDSNVFKPEMSHQVFGDSESIFGYKDLRVNVYCSAGKLTTYVDMKFTEKINPTMSEGVQADDVMKLLSERLQPGFLTSQDDFIAQLAKDANLKPFGELMHSYTVSKDGEDRRFEVYKTGIDTPGFRSFHERLQPFLLFYVDAASYIDVEDDRWTYYVVFEKYKCNGNPMYATVGYMTAYNYFAYPERIRPRVSQVLVLPPFQRQGHGATLLQTFYNDCYGQAEVKDITVEDPSENFQRVRDFVDARNCMKLSSFAKDKLTEGFSDDMEHDAREKLKINKKQARRIYEILRLKATDRSNKEEFRQYRLDIKKRLNVPFQKNGRDFDKLSTALAPTELAATMNNSTREQRFEYLEKTFEECVTEYSCVLERLSVE